MQQLREIALGFMRREGLITVQEVHKFMRDSGLVQAAPSRTSTHSYHEVPKE